jgi:hypothetical protein
VKHLKLRFRAAVSVWWNIEAFVDVINFCHTTPPLLRDALKNMDDAARVLAAQRDEIDRLNRVAAEDARMLLAYSRWCARKGCAPSSRDLMDMVKR